MIPNADPNMIVWFRERFLPLSEANVSILTHALHYGTGVFEGIRGYWRAEDGEVGLFRAEDHYARWIRNASLLRMALPWSPAELTAITAELVRLNHFETDLYFRPLVFRSAQRIGIQPNDEFAAAIIPLPMGAYIDSTNGIHAGVVSWRRVEDNAIPGRAKICGAYVNSALAGDEARRNGYDEAIFLTESGHVAEGASCNIFAMRGHRLLTPPESDNILEGITRETIMELARTVLGLEVQERSLDRSELYLAGEVFFTGTAVEVAPIVRIDHRPIGNGQVGLWTSSLRQLYYDVTHGRHQAWRHWLHGCCSNVGVTG